MIRKLCAAVEKHIKLISHQIRRCDRVESAQNLAKTSGTQLHPSTQQWSSRKSCSQESILPTWEQGQALTYTWKHTVRNWAAEKWQQVLWTHGSKFGTFGCSRRQFVCQRAAERYANESLQATLMHGGG